MFHCYEVRPTHIEYSEDLLKILVSLFFPDTPDIYNSKYILNKEDLPKLRGLYAGIGSGHPLGFSCPEAVELKNIIKYLVENNVSLLINY